MTSRKLRPDLAISDGLVVTPSSSPVAASDGDFGGIGGVGKEFHAQGLLLDGAALAKAGAVGNAQNPPLELV